MDYSFDSLDQPAHVRQDEPIWSMDLDNPDSEGKILSWLNGELDYLLKENEPRIKKVRKNLQVYKGIQYLNQERRQEIRNQEGQDKNRVFDKIVVNDCYDITKNLVSRLIKYKPAVAILPTNDEYGDKIAAKASGYLLDHIWYIQNFEGDKAPTAATVKSVMGEAYLMIDWDPSAGDIHPESEKMGGKAPVPDENGNPKKDDQGNIILVDKTIKVGDVYYKVEYPDNVLLERCPQYEMVEYAFVREVLPVQRARNRYPKNASKIKSSQNAQIYNYEKAQHETQKNSVEVWHFWHKATEELPQGRHIAFTRDAICANTKLEFNHGEFPWERLSDVDIPGEPHAVSYFDFVAPIVAMRNNINNMILENILLASRPKWMLPAGACKLDSLGNAITMVQFKGPIAPQLVTAPTTPSEVFKYRDDLLTEAQRMSGLFGVSRGEPPKGITAAVALQFLAEQESERFNESVLKFNEWVRRIAKKTLAVAGDKYQEDDERMVRVLGKNNKWMSEKFNVAYLSRDYDVRIQNTSALPQSKAARTEYLVWLSQTFPEQLPPEQILDLLDLSQSDKFLSLSTVSVRAAEAENDFLLEGKDTGEPTEWEDHINHWQAHVKPIMEFSFKNQTPQEIQDKLIDHVRAHEMFMLERAKLDPLYMEQLAVLKGFPKFFYPEMPQVPMGEPPIPEEQPMAEEPMPEAMLAEEPMALNPENPGPIEPTQGV